MSHLSVCLCFDDDAWNVNRSGIFLLYSILPACRPGASGFGTCQVTCVTLPEGGQDIRSHGYAPIYTYSPPIM